MMVGTATIPTDSGYAFTFDFDKHTVTANVEEGLENAEPWFIKSMNDWADYYQRAMNDGTDDPKLVGPQVDEFAGVTGSWDSPRYAAVAMILEHGAHTPTDAIYEPPIPEEIPETAEEIIYVDEPDDPETVEEPNEAETVEEPNEAETVEQQANKPHS